MFQRLFAFLLSVICVFGPLQPAWSAELTLSGVQLDRCADADPGSQPELSRALGASCYVLRGEVVNRGQRPIVDTDVFARILDATGEPVLQNRTRIGSIGDVDPGKREFALRLSVPAGTPGPFIVKNPRARGFSAPVRSRAEFDDDDLLPLELGISDG